MTTTQVAVPLDQRLPDPAPGSEAVVLPVDDAPQRRAVVREWHAGPAGLVVTADLSMEASDVEELAGQRVWVRAASPDGGARVIEGVAGASGPQRLHLTGVVALAVESRRAAPRAGHRAPVRISMDAYALGHASDVQRELSRQPLPAEESASSEELAAAAAHGETVDLSTSGARVALPPDDLERARRAGSISIEVGLGSDTVHLGGEVVRVDDAAGEVAVRFLDLDESGRARLERAVLTELSPAGSDDAAGAGAPSVAGVTMEG